MAIEIVSQNDCLVVDSRLIANELGIEHRALRQTIEKYVNEIQEFGVVTFQMSKPLEGSSGGRPERHCYLNEDQATFLMTLSRNTPQVIDCKRNLVKAFSQAKQIIKEVIPAQNEHIRSLELQLEISQNHRHILDKSEAILSIHGPGMLALIKGVPDAIVPIKEKLTETVVIQNGRSVSFVGKSLADMARELGFKSGKDLERWLERIDRSDLISQGMRAVGTPYIAEDHVPELRKVWSNKMRSHQRQLLIGE